MFFENYTEENKMYFINLSKFESKLTSILGFKIIKHLSINLMAKLI